MKHNYILVGVLLAFLLLFGMIALLPPASSSHSDFQSFSSAHSDSAYFKGCVLVDRRLLCPLSMITNELARIRIMPTGLSTLSHPAP